MPRKGVSLAIAVAWNVPLVSICYFGFTSTISERAMNLLLAGWTSMIPIFAMLVAYAPPLQRLLFTPGFDNASMRSRLWGVVFLWTVISGFWIGSTLLGHYPVANPFAAVRHYTTKQSP